MLCSVFRPSTVTSRKTHVDLTNIVDASRVVELASKDRLRTPSPPPYKILIQICTNHRNDEICLENIGNPLKNGNVLCLKYIAICVKMLKLLVSKILSLQNDKFYSCQIKLVYSIEIWSYTFISGS